MRRHWVVGALVAGLTVAGCTGHSKEQDDGWSMIVAQDFAGARAHYQTLLADDPNNPYLNLNLGVAFDELGDKEMAAKHYRVAIANGRDAEIAEVADDGNVAKRASTVANVARQNLAALGG